jgi:hypothetical protein
MAILTSISALTAQIGVVGKSKDKLRDQIQDLLVSCAYHAAKDGQVGPYNMLLDAVRDTARVRGITMWIETYGFGHVQKDRIVVSKTARKEANVTDLASFAEFAKSMEEGAKWYEIAPKEQISSIFDPVRYGMSVKGKFEKEGLADLGLEVEKLVVSFMAKRNAEISQLIADANAEQEEPVEQE